MATLSTKKISCLVRRVAGRAGRPLSAVGMWLLAVGCWLSVGATSASAAVSFGSGVYTNLCGSGTAATTYTCNAGCNVATGICQSNNNSVVKWTCPGRWEQCLESETGWSNDESLANTACGRTVQISLFDKKCRLEDGSWDNTCNLRGYMVWYSGDCRAGFSSPTPTQPGSPTATPTPKSRFNLFPSVTPSPSSTPTPAPTGVNVACGAVCGPSRQCGAGFACVDGQCRNPSCIDDTSCFCAGATGSTKGGVTKSPETGVNTWLLGLGAVVAVGAGWKIRRLASKVI